MENKKVEELVVESSRICKLVCQDSPLKILPQLVPSVVASFAPDHPIDPLLGDWWELIISPTRQTRPTLI